MPLAKNPFKLGIFAICINLALMIIKIGVGVLGSSYALIADGIESASDIFTSIVTWIGFRLSLKPADEDHPYGHGKIDALTGIFSGVCLFAAALFIGYESIIEIRTPHHLPAWFTLPVLVAVVIAKELLSRRVFAAADTLDSSALKGDAWHHRSDAVTSAAAAIGITIALIGGEDGNRPTIGALLRLARLSLRTLLSSYGIPPTTRRTAPSRRNSEIQSVPQRRRSPESLKSRSVLSEKAGQNFWSSFT